MIITLSLTPKGINVNFGPECVQEEVICREFAASGAKIKFSVELQMRDPRIDYPAVYTNPSKIVTIPTKDVYDKLGHPTHTMLGSSTNHTSLEKAGIERFISHD